MADYVTLIERIAKVEQRQDDFEEAVEDEVARIRFWVKLVGGIIGSAVVGPLVAWLWPIIREAI